MTRRICALGGCILLLGALLGGMTAQEKDTKKDPPKVDKVDFKPRKIELKESGREVFKMEFAADKKVEIRVESELQTDVDLYVYDAANRQVAADTRAKKDCFVSFTPKKTQVYRIEVVNLGPGDNKCTVYFSAGPPPNSIELKPFDIKEDGEITFQIRFAAGVRAEVWVESEKNSDVDLYVYDADNDKVASDTRISKDCQVSFTPKKTQVFRVLVVNLGPGANRCKLRHTTAEAGKGKTDEDKKKDEPKKSR